MRVREEVVIVSIHVGIIDVLTVVNSEVGVNTEVIINIVLVVRFVVRDKIVKQREIFLYVYFLEEIVCLFLFMNVSSLSLLKGMVIVFYLVVSF